jgi:hypothetical protein
MTTPILFHAIDGVLHPRGAATDFGNRAEGVALFRWLPDGKLSLEVRDRHYNWRLHAGYHDNWVTAGRDVEKYDISLSKSSGGWVANMSWLEEGSPLPKIVSASGSRPQEAITRAVVARELGYLVGLPADVVQAVAAATASPEPTNPSRPRIR